MRVVHLNQDAGTGPERAKGAAVHVNALREAFAQLGCELLTLDGGSPTEAIAWMLAEHARAPIVLVYERYALGADAGSRFARATGVPLVLEVNAPLLDEARAYRSHRTEPHQAARGGSEAERASAHRQREQSIFAGATRVLAVSSQVARYVLDVGAEAGIDLEERVWVRPNGYDPERFHPRGREAARRRLGLAPDSFVVGFHGRLRPWHGFETIAAALELLVERTPNAHLLLAGVGDFSESLSRRGLEARTTRIEWMPHAEVGAVVSAFDVLALGYAPGGPDYFSPLKLFEAMACGAVPVVPDVGDLPVHVAHGRSGVVYPAGDVAALAGELAHLARDRGRREYLQRGAIEAAGPHTWSRIAREVLAVARTERLPAWSPRTQG